MSRRTDREAGRMRLGCLFGLCVIAVGLYFGVQFAEVQFRYYRIQDAVDEQAGFATVLDDATIRSRLVAESDRLGIPLGSGDWTVRRTFDIRAGTRSITIEGKSYQDSVVINLWRYRRVWTFTFQPKAVQTYR